MYLTSRERQCLHLIAEGRTDKLIGNALFLSENTIKVHVGHLYAKLGARNRAHSVALGYETGLLKLKDV